MNPHRLQLLADGVGRLEVDPFILLDAQVVAVEPEPGNFAMLCENVRGLSVRCVQGAVASSSGRTRLVDPGLGSCAYRTDPSGPGIEVPKIAMSDILREYG